VYKEGRKRLSEGRDKKREWCRETKAILEKFGLVQFWEGQAVGNAREWGALVRHAVNEREHTKWRWGMLQGGQKVNGVRLAKRKLLVYMKVKETMKKEWWLQENRLWVRR
jgi:hypothetical protein